MATIYSSSMSNTTTAAKSSQDLLNDFYNLDTLVKLDIDINPDTWDKLRLQKPKGEWGHKGGRYDWFETNSVTISTRSFQSRKFNNVGMIKKSFAGSKDEIKPSFRLNFTKFDKSNEDEIMGLIGTSVLVLNNCKQDQDYIRQPFGYRLLRQAGVPSLRCNLATVSINGKKMGVFANVECFKKPFLENRFNNAKGNAYELELQQDIVPFTWSPGDWYGTPSFEGFSKHDNEKDIKLAAEKIDNWDFGAVQKVIDLDAFVKFWAMESLLKHWDGFTQKINNTFMYNDTACVANPGVDNIRFKFVPSGIDQILKPGEPFRIGDVPVLAQVCLDNEATKKKLYKQIRDYANGEVFNQNFYDGQLKRLRAVLCDSSTLPASQVDQSINTIRSQMEEVKKEALRL